MPTARSRAASKSTCAPATSRRDWDLRFVNQSPRRMHRPRRGRFPSSSAGRLYVSNVASPPDSGATDTSRAAARPPAGTSLAESPDSPAHAGPARTPAPPPPAPARRTPPPASPANLAPGDRPGTPATGALSCVFEQRVRPHGRELRAQQRMHARRARNAGRRTTSPLQTSAAAMDRA